MKRNTEKCVSSTTQVTKRKWALEFLVPTRVLLLINLSQDLKQIILLLRISVSSSVKDNAYFTELL